LVGVGVGDEIGGGDLESMEELDFSGVGGPSMSLEEGAKRASSSASSA